MKQTYCPGCKKIVGEGRFCGVCGSTLQTMEIPDVTEEDSPTVLLSDPVVDVPSDATVMLDDSFIPSDQTNNQTDQINHTVIPDLQINQSSMPVQPELQTTQNTYVTNTYSESPVTDFATVPTQNTFAVNNTPSTPLLSVFKKSRMHVTTLIGLILLGVYVISAFVVAMIDSSRKLKDLAFFDVSISRVWFFVIFAVSLVFFAMAVIGRRWFAIAGVALIGIMIVVTLVLAVFSGKGYSDISFTSGLTINFGPGSEASKTFVFNYYGLAMLKTGIFWIASLVLLILGRIFEVKADRKQTLSSANLN